MLVYGQALRIPLDIELNHILHQEHRSPTDSYFVFTHALALERAHEQARQYLDRYKQKYEAAYNSKLRPRSFDIGDLVGPKPKATMTSSLRYGVDHSASSPSHLRTLIFSKTNRVPHFHRLFRFRRLSLLDLILPSQNLPLHIRFLILIQSLLFRRSLSLFLRHSGPLHRKLRCLHLILRHHRFHRFCSLSLCHRLLLFDLSQLPRIPLFLPQPLLRLLPLLLASLK